MSATYKVLRCVVCHYVLYLSIVVAGTIVLGRLSFEPGGGLALLNICVDEHYWCKLRAHSAEGRDLMLKLRTNSALRETSFFGSQRIVYSL